jgi:hypothetical protein
MLIESKANGLQYSRNSLAYRAHAPSDSYRDFVDVPASDAFAPERPLYPPPPSYDEIVSSFSEDKDLPALPYPPDEKSPQRRQPSFPAPILEESIDGVSPEQHDVSAELVQSPSSNSSPNPSFGAMGLVDRPQRGASRRGLSEPPCFTRMPNPAFTFPPFATVWLYTKDKTLETGWPLAAPRSLAQQAHPFATHDVRELDWRRCVRSVFA